MAQVNQVAAEFRKASNRQIADTAKRTIRENVSICSQLTKISDKTVELIANNDCLKERERRQRQEIELLQTSETLMTEKNIANQKVILPVYHTYFPRIHSMWSHVRKQRHQFLIPNISRRRIYPRAFSSTEPLSVRVALTLDT